MIVSDVSAAIPADSAGMGVRLGAVVSVMETGELSATLAAAGARTRDAAASLMVPANVGVIESRAVPTGWFDPSFHPTGRPARSNRHCRRTHRAIW
jgi:hypothetical protein